MRGGRQMSSRPVRISSRSRSMLEILVAIVALICMAGRRSRRRWTADDRMVPWLSNSALTTLADATVIVASSLAASDRSYRCLSMNTLWGWRGATVGEGPIVVGYCHADYTVTEVKEALEAEGTMVTNNKVAAEQANRLVRIVGQLPFDSEDGVLNDGKPIRTRLNWAIPLGGNVNIFSWNRSGATLTTGAVTTATGDARIKFT